jgi:alkylation response protein AidB-like acyl-CoA dehydrogenase
MGGIGFTWEHDAHLFLRRAGFLQTVVGPLEDLATEVGRSRTENARPRTSIALPPEAGRLRAEVEAFRDAVLAAEPGERHAMVVDQGYLHPEWPRPWGRAAGPLEQLVIEESLRGVDRRAALGPTYWEVPIVLPTVLEWGSPDQVERWMRPSMMGELRWCQLFSEPSAGSDLAALRTRAVRAEGGWRVTGQKVWTSDAHHADRGMTLVRTDPDAPKHAGISCFMIDLRSPGVTIRPLVQITGEAHFNEVFLDDVFVPDGDVLGPVDAGWKVTRTTLANERVSLGAGTSLWTSGPVWEQAVARTAAAVTTRPDLMGHLGRIVLQEEGATALRLRSARRALLGQPAGIDGTIAKTIVADLAQSVGDFCLEAAGERGALLAGEDAGSAGMFLAVRMATIAGGTSEILRNLLAERALGMPREPESA